MNPIHPLRAMLSLILAGLCADAHASSFNEVKERIYAHPEATLPTYSVPLGPAILDALKSFTGELITRGRITLSDTSDFKPIAPKLIHTYGVCATGTWTINRASFATGLFDPGAEGGEISVPAVARLSSATPATVYKAGNKRNFGIAVKLFPTRDLNQSVLTRNIFTLDQTGLTGDDRASFFFSGGAGNSVFFTNDVPGTGFLAQLGQRTFEKLDPPSTFRALYPVAEVGVSGRRVEHPVAPHLIRIVPRMERAHGAVPADFRTEILQYGARGMQFDLVLPEQYGAPASIKIGSLTLENPVISTECDQELTFHHAPENRNL